MSLWSLSLSRKFARQLLLFTCVVLCFVAIGPSNPVNADTIIDSIAIEAYTNTVTVSPDGSLVAYTEQSTNKVHFLDSTLTLIRSSSAMMDPNTVIIDSTNTYAYVGARNGQVINTVEIATGNVIASTSTLAWNNSCLLMLPGGTHLLSCEGVSLAKRAVSDLQSGTSTYVSASFGTVVISAQASSDGSRIYVSESAGNVAVLDSSLNVIDNFGTPNGYNVFLALSPDDSLLAVTDFSSNTTKILDALTGTTITTLPFSASLFNPTGSLLYGLGGSSYEKVLAVRIPTLELVKSQNVSTGSLLSLAFHPAGNYLLAISQSPSIEKFAIGPDLVLHASAATASSGNVEFTLEANETVICSTLSTTIGEDFDAVGIDSIDLITQTSSTECTISVTSSARAGLGPVTSSLSPATSFSITGLTTLVADMFGVADQGSTVVTIAGSSTTTTSTTTTSSTVATTTTSAPTTTSSTQPIDSLPKTGRRTSSDAWLAFAIVLLGIFALTLSSRRRVISSNK